MWSQLLGLVLSAIAPEGPLSDAELKARIAAFDLVYEAKDAALPALHEHEIIQALAGLANIDHPALAKRLVALSKDKRELIRVTAVRLLGNQESGRRAASLVLVQFLGAKDVATPVLREAVRAAGRLKLREAIEPLAGLLRHPSDEVALETVRAFGEIGSLAALPHLLSFLELNLRDPDESVFVPPHSGGGKPKRPGPLRGPDAVAIAREVLRTLTGAELSSPDEIREWMRKNRARIKHDFAERQ